MCGIAGFFGHLTTQDPPSNIVRRMVQTIAHRGPDASGIHVEPGIALGHARLSIIDLASGLQPMSNADRTIWITFNGEIFNYIELRRELIARGHRFTSDSDTEVILKAYEEMGTDCVDHFNGDFAFAIWDKRKNQLVMARDRMGVRPLYYTQQDGALVFASEVKALLAFPHVSAELDPVALDQIFTFWFPLAPRTIFRGIQELPPAHVLVANPSGLTIRRYWKLTYPSGTDADGYDRRHQGEIEEELSALFLDSVRLRLRADVPVGAYLSGGLDSAIVVAAIDEIARERLRTFSVTFESKEFDETPYQNELVREFKTTHAQAPCSTADIARLFPAAIRHTEQPILRTAPAPLYVLSKLVRSEGHKVVLTGEGADEIFAGYDIFKESKIRRFCAAQPQSHRRRLLLRRLYPYLPGLQGQSQKYLEVFFGSEQQSLHDPLFSHLPRFHNTAAIKAFYSGETRSALQGYDALAELRDCLPAEFKSWHPLSQAQYLETSYLLPGYILSSQGDRMAMANGIEGRFPFLDHRLVEFASRIPPTLKLRVMREKHVLRESARKLLPSSIRDRTKQPYRAPECRSFFGEDAPRYVANEFSTREIGKTGIFNPQMVERLYNKCQRQNVIGFRDNTAFVGVLSTQLWHRSFVQKSEQASAPNIVASAG